MPGAAGLLDAASAEARTLARDAVWTRGVLAHSAGVDVIVWHDGEPIGPAHGLGKRTPLVESGFRVPGGRHARVDRTPARCDRVAGQRRHRVREDRRRLIFGN